MEIAELSTLLYLRDPQSLTGDLRKIVAQAGALQSRTPTQLATLAATALSAALARDPDTDIEAFVHAYDGALQPVVVAMKDGRTAAVNVSFRTMTDAEFVARLEET